MLRRVPYYLSLTTGEPSGLYDPPAMVRLGQAYEQLEEIEGRLQALGADIGS